ncbi:hypothetical protein [Frankia nepalensis]|uniref:hypothetical protein n=1 Tax=Frankia nepalensis TaxID=1836974 RepID=UPI001EE4CD99|nr:hypothetical protein [Frankia nepalensis]
MVDGAADGLGVAGAVGCRGAGGLVDGGGAAVVALPVAGWVAGWAVASVAVVGMAADDGAEVPALAGAGWADGPPKGGWQPVATTTTTTAATTPGKARRKGALPAEKSAGRNDTRESLLDGAPWAAGAGVPSERGR